MNRAVRFHAVGGPDVLKIEDVAISAPGSGELRVRSEAVGVSRGEALFREGKYVYPPNPPCWYGAEGSAIVEAVGEDVTGFAPGDRICFMPTFYAGTYGMCADVALMPASAAIRAPAGLSPIEVAATWVSYSTAYALVEIAKIEAGNVVLITAASSSVGTAAIQITKAMGAIAIAVTRTTDKVEALKAIGADHVVVTGEQNLVTEVMRLTEGKGADVVFDPIAGKLLGPLCEATAEGGQVILYGELGSEPTPFPLVTAAVRGLNVRGFVAPKHIWSPPARLERCRSFVQKGIDDGWLKPVIDRVFPFEQVVQAHRYLESNNQVGKIVIEI